MRNDLLKPKESEHNVDWAYDANLDLAQRKAESKAYDMLTAAALSETTTHSITVMSDEGLIWHLLKFQ